MANASMPARNLSRDSAKESVRTHLQVTAYDRSSSLLIALLIIVGTFFVGIAIIWFFNNRAEATADAVFEIEKEGGNEMPKGLAQDPEPPGFEDAEEQDIPEIPPLLTELSSSESLMSAMTAEFASDATGVASKGSGLGDNRASGIGGGIGIKFRVPRAERWKFNLKNMNESTFARYLDSKKIKLGMMNEKTFVIKYADSFSSGPKPAGAETFQEMKSRRDDWTMPLSATDVSIITMERSLLKKAGIPLVGMEAEFFPHSLVAEIVTAELMAASEKLGRKPSEVTENDVRRTEFDIVEEGGTFKFVVVDCQVFE